MKAEQPIIWATADGANGHVGDKEAIDRHPTFGRKWADDFGRERPRFVLFDHKIKELVSSHGFRREPRPCI